MSLFTRIKEALLPKHQLVPETAQQAAKASVRQGSALALLEHQLTTNVERFKTDALFRNAVYLMASTAVMGVFGLGLWVVMSHLYTPDQVGQASVLIAISVLIGNVSALGLDAGMIRFLAKSKNRSADINAAVVLVALASVVASIGYLLWVGDDLAGKLTFFNAGTLGRVIFIVMMASVSVNSFLDSIFIASRRVEFHTAMYSVFGFVKFALPIFLFPLASLGIIWGYFAAVLASMTLSIYCLRKYCSYHVRTAPHWAFLSSTMRYTSNNYIASLLAGVPQQVLPSIVLLKLGAANAAYFALAWSMVALLFVGPAAVAKSMLAEGSHDATKRGQNLMQSIKLMAALVVPSVVLSIVLAPWMLRLFGPAYAHGSTLLFQLLALGTFSYAATTIGNTIMNLEHRGRGLVIVQAVSAAILVALSWILMPKMGVAGVGVAVLASYLVGNLFQFAMLARREVKKRGGIRLMRIAGSGPSDEVVSEALSHYALEDARVGADIGGGDRSGTFIVKQGRHSYVLKVLSARKRSYEQLDEEVAYMRFLKDRGIHTPDVVSDTEGSLVTAVTVGPELWFAILMSHEAGQQPVRLTPELMSSMAKVQGQIHVQSFDYARSLGDRLRVVRGRSYLSRLLTFMPRGISHFDFYSNNVLARGNQVTCAIDFESMRYDPLVVCVIFTLIRLYDDFHSQEDLARYLASYQTVRRLSRLERLVVRIGLSLRFQSPKLLLLSV